MCVISLKANSYQLTGVFAILLMCFYSVAAEGNNSIFQGVFKKRNISLEKVSNNKKIKTESIKVISAKGNKLDLDVKANALVMQSKKEFGSMYLDYKLNNQELFVEQGFTLSCDITPVSVNDNSIFYLHIGCSATISNLEAGINYRYNEDLTASSLTMALKPGLLKGYLNLLGSTKQEIRFEKATAYKVKLKIISRACYPGLPAYAKVYINGKRVAGLNFYWTGVIPGARNTYLNYEEDYVSSLVFGLQGVGTAVSVTKLEIASLDDLEKQVPYYYIGKLDGFWRYMPLPLIRGNVENYSIWEPYKNTDFPYFMKKGPQEDYPFSDGVNFVRILGGIEKKPNTTGGKKGIPDLRQDLASRNENGEIIYHWDRLRAKMKIARELGDYEYTFVLDNVPFCFPKKVVMGGYGNEAGPGDVKEWYDFIQALCRELKAIFGEKKANKFRFRLLTEARIYSKWPSKKEREHPPFEEFAVLYDYSAEAVKSILPKAKFGPYNMSGLTIKKLRHDEYSLYKVADHCLKGENTVNGTIGKTPFDFFCVSKYYDYRSDPDHYALQNKRSWEDFDNRYPKLKAIPKEIHEYNPAPWVKKNPKVPGVFGGSLTAHMIIRLREQGLSRLYHWGVTEPKRLLPNAQAWLFLILDHMRGGQSYVYRPANAFSPYKTKHLALGSFKKEKSFLFLTAHNTDIGVNEEEVLTYVIPKKHFMHSYKQIEYTYLSKQNDPLRAVRDDLAVKNLLKPEYHDDKTHISYLNEMLKGDYRKGVGFIKKNKAKYEAMYKESLLLKKFPYTCEESGSNIVLEIPMRPATMMVVVFE